MQPETQTDAKIRADVDGARTLDRLFDPVQQAGVSQYTSRQVDLDVRSPKAALRSLLPWPWKHRVSGVFRDVHIGYQRFE
jgi:hypothetical protein